MLTAQPEGPSREQRVKHGMKLRTVIGSPGYPSDEAALRAFVEKNVDRRWYPEGGARQYLSIIASGDRVELRQVDRPRAGLGRVLAQTLEHGTQPIVPARADADGRAAFCESLGERGADPGRCSGDQHLLAVK